jgi:hypothetical protein
MRRILEKMFQSRRLSKKIRGQGQKDVLGRAFPANLPKFVLIIYGLLKRSQGQQLPEPDPELINTKSLDFAKPKISSKILDATQPPRHIFTSGFCSTSPRSWT